MPFPAARIGDPITHDMVTPCGVIGPPLQGPMMPPVIIEGLPAAHVSCSVLCTGVITVGLVHPPWPPLPPGPPPLIMMGSPTVMINGFPAARWASSGDFAACTAFLGLPPLSPARTTWIGP